MQANKDKAPRRYIVLFVGMCVLGVILGIVAFFVVRNIKHAPAEEMEEEEEVPATTRKRSSTSKKTARSTKPAAGIPLVLKRLRHRLISARWRHSWTRWQRPLP